MAKFKSTEQDMINDIKHKLGSSLIEVELDPKDYSSAIKFALGRYRQRSSNSVNDRAMFLELQPSQTVYYLPEEIVEIHQIYRRGTTGTTSGSGLSFDPFSSAFVDQMVLTGGINEGNLTTYELFSGFQELIGRMFGLWINYSWDPSEHRLEIVRDIRAPETVLLHVYTYRPDEELFSDIYARPWLRDYAVASCKEMLGQIRGKYASLAGPQGGISLNSADLKQEAQAEYDRLEREVNLLYDQRLGYGFTIG